MAEKELKVLQREDVIVPNKRKKRSLREISIHEQAKIIQAVTRDFTRQEDVACEYRTSPALVCRLVRQHRKDPFILSKKLAKEHKQNLTEEAVNLEVAEMLRDRVAIESASLVKVRLQVKHNMNVSLPRVQAIMKQKLGLSYRTAKKVPKQGNTERCLVLR